MQELAPLLRLVVLTSTNTAQSKAATNSRLGHDSNSEVRGWDTNLKAEQSAGFPTSKLHVPLEAWRMLRALGHQDFKQ